MRFLFTADWHLSDRAFTDYRWELIPWLATRIRSKEVTDLFILGDLTDAKGNHKAEFVTKVVEAVESLSRLCHVHFLVGNHDFLEAKEWPFFGFMNLLPNITVYRQQETRDVRGIPICFLPYGHHMPHKGASRVAAESARFVLFHEPLIGAVSAYNHVISKGHSPAQMLKGLLKGNAHLEVLGGDIHKPQVVSGCEYIGSPHPVSFGENHSPRVLLWDGSKMTAISRRSIRRSIVTMPADALLVEHTDCSEGDHIKIRAGLYRHQVDQWGELRASLLNQAESIGLVVVDCAANLVEAVELQGDDCADLNAVEEGATEVLSSYVQEHQVAEQLQRIGEQFLDEAKKSTN